VLDDDAGRPLGGQELGGEFVGGVGVVDVVVAQLLALVLVRRGHARPVRAVDVEGGALVRVLAVAQGLAQRSGKGPAAGRVLADGAGHPGGDGGIVGGGARKRPLRQRAAEGQARLPVVPVHLLQKGGVVAGIGQHGDMGVVLGGGADHRRPADIDVLHRLGLAGTARHRRLERVEVDDQEVDGRDAVRLHRRHMRGIVAQGQQPAMHAGVQGLHAAVHHLGEAGHVGHVAHLQPLGAQLGRAAAGRDQLHPAGRKGVGQFAHPGLVGNGNQRAADRGEVGHRRSG